MRRKKLSLMNISDDKILSRDEMKYIMAGSGGGSSTNWIFCDYGNTFCEQCATYDGSSAYDKCTQKCGDYPQFASWGTAQNCSDGGW